jgi:hypothetical protein
MTKASDAQIAKKHVRTLSDALYVCLHSNGLTQRHSNGLTQRDYRKFGQALTAARKWLSNPAPQVAVAEREQERDDGR